MAPPKPRSSDGESQRFQPEASLALPPELAMARLPAGRHGLSRAFVASNQRRRLVAAMLRVLPRLGYPETTIGDVTGEAAVSRAAFYAQFASKEDCFLATYEVTSGWFCGSVERAVAGEEEWSARIRTGVAEALRLLAANPTVAHLLAIEAAQAGAAGRARQQAMLDRFAAALRAEHPGPPDLPEDLAHLLLGGAVALIARYVDGGRVEQLPEATAVMAEYILIPYTGGSG